jgi:alpha-ketoglutarate-dependent taurine dioxygenase
MTATVETVKLTETVAAEVRGVDVDRLLHDEDLPAWTHDALEANSVLVFRDLYIDDAAQVAFSKRLGRVEVLGQGEHPEIFLVTLDPAKNRSAPVGRRSVASPSTTLMLEPRRCDHAVPEGDARQVMNTGIDRQPRTVEVGAIATLS